jgi:starch phosphorylase
MITTLPRFNAQRMVMDYVARFYGPAARQGETLSADNHHGARDLARWKQHVDKAWPQIKLRRLDTPTTEIKSGQRLSVRVAAHLNGLKPEDLTVECLFGTQSDSGGDFVASRVHRLSPEENTGSAETLYVLDLPLDACGLYE